MKKITDERLVLQNLQHIRIAFIVQTLGILAILVYEVYEGGLDAMRANPVWHVFMLTSIVYAYLSMSTSVAHEKPKNPKKGFMISGVVVGMISIAVAVLTAMTPGFGWGDGALIGGVMLVCGAIPVTYMYKLRVKQLKEWEDEDDR